MNRTLEWQSDGTKLIVKCVALRDSIDWPAEWSKSVRLSAGRRNLWRCLIIGTRGPINSGLCESKLARASISARLPALSMCSSGEPVGAVVNYTPVIAQISAICGAILRSRRNARARGDRVRGSVHLNGQAFVVRPIISRTDCWSNENAGGGAFLRHTLELYRVSQII